MDKRFIIFFLLLFFFSPLIFSQEFEGILTYKNEFYPRIPNYGIQNNGQKSIDTVFLFYKEGKIKILMPFLHGMILCLGDEEYYVFQKELVRHAGYKNDLEKLDSISFYIKKTRHKEKVLRYECEKYEVLPDYYGDGYESISFWSTNLLKLGKINVNNYYFKDFGVVFKSIMKFEAGIHIEQLIDIKQTGLDNKIFELPDYPIREVDMNKLSKQYVKSYFNGK
jgi:hypothetical protein